MPRYIEPVEPRTLFAAFFAPSTLGGSDIHVTPSSGGVTGGDPYDLKLSATDDTFVFSPAFPGSDGTWAFSRTSATTAHLYLWRGGLSDYVINFTSYTSGNYKVEIDGFTQPAERGTFTLAGFDSLVQLDGDVLRVSGTVGPDGVGMSARRGTLFVTHNNTTRTFPSDAVQQVSIELGDGNDELGIATGVGAVLALGGLGNDTLVGGDANDTLIGGGGRDFLAGGPGDDLLSGLAQNDTLRGGNGADRLRGGDHNDFLAGGLGVDRLYAGAGNDTLLGESSSDVLYGEAGNDLLRGGAGGDLIDGGADEDTTEPDPDDLLVAVELTLGAG